MQLGPLVSIDSAPSLAGFL
jgi:hypothetical protein